jgi:UDP-2-acetamido-2,6-beta-L-arabino-hexul-4-ose reductase
MIVGIGLIANNFRRSNAKFHNVCIYAAGVSNSLCNDSNEFERERQCLNESLRDSVSLDCFVYFSTCSVDDPEVQKTPYVLHKLAMERLVKSHARYLILRLPHVAGNSFNPHTLLNFLQERISRSESFQLWGGAYRNIIDVDDVTRLATYLIENTFARNMIVNIAAPYSYSVIDIVKLLESTVGKSAIYELINRESKYEIDLSDLKKLIGECWVNFDDDYLKNVIDKYYEKIT